VENSIGEWLSAWRSATRRDRRMKLAVSIIVMMTLITRKFGFCNAYTDNLAGGSNTAFYMEKRKCLSTFGQDCILLFQIKLSFRSVTPQHSCISDTGRTAIRNVRQSFLEK